MLTVVKRPKSVYGSDVEMDSEFMYRARQRVYVESMKLGPGLTFSWKRALGVTKAKRKISRATGVPLTRQGRRSKLGRWMGMK